MKKTILIVLGVAIGIGASIALRHHFTKTPVSVDRPVDADVKQKREEEDRRNVAWKIIAPRIEIAQEEALKAVETRTNEVRDFFAERQKRVPGYAERVLSFRSKLELAKSKLPYTDKDGHTAFLKEEFSKLVFSQAELNQQVTGALNDCIRDIQAIENALLVKIRADLSDMPECVAVMPDLKSEALFRDRFEKVVISLSQKAGTDTKVDVGRMVGSEIAGAIAVRVGIAVATRLGVSGAIIGTGGALAPETLGASIVVGVAVDQIAGWVIGWFYKPEAEIGKRLTEELNGLSTLIVNGDNKTRGLKQELVEIAQRRKKMRDDGLRGIILQPGIWP